MEQGKNYPIGLYRHIQTGAVIGALDETQANAFANWGYELVREAHSTTEVTDWAKEENLSKATSSQDDAQTDDKKGKK